LKFLNLFFDYTKERLFLANKVWKQQRQDNRLRLLCSGDHGAFARFIEKHKESVFLCCRRLRLREEEVEDVASETFLAAYNGLSRYSGRAELGTWLWAIAYRQGISYLRKNRKYRQFKTEQNELLFRGREREPAVAVQAKEADEIVWEAVDQLPRLWTMAIILYYREEKSIVEIARIMRTKESTIKIYLFRARKRLKKVLAPALGEAMYVG
jgi:RNA polymerase sigma-70 factor (ECF subfamily)